MVSCWLGNVRCSHDFLEMLARRVFGISRSVTSERGLVGNNVVSFYPIKVIVSASRSTMDSRKVVHNYTTIHACAVKIMFL